MKRLFVIMLLIAAPLVAGTPARAAASGLAPVFGASDWINGRLNSRDVAGKVVIVDVFTFGCINCKHVLPNLQHLHATLPATDLAIIGVHAPETPEEHDRANVVRELARQGIVWPVAVDNNFAIWHALDNAYWPTQYIFDRHGALRRTVVGEGQDDVVNATVNALVTER
jgi:thiol-disulfide isomerase/thioredoxin